MKKARNDRAVGPGTGYAAAVVLAAVFVRAATAKLARRDDTVGTFAALGLPAAGVLAWGVPAGELLLAATLLAAPRAGGAGALVVLVAFSAVLARAVRAGITAPCACFGTAATRPVSSADLLRNGLLGLLAAWALLTSRPVVPDPAAAAVVAAAVVSGYGVLAAWRRRLNTG